MKPFDPSNPWLSIWRHLIFAGVLISLFVVPFQVAFDPEFSPSMLVLASVIHAAFVLDMAIIANTAYWQSGRLIADRRRIWTRYVTGTFWLDFLANFPFEIFILVLPAEIGGIPTTRLLSLPHMLRIHRLAQSFNDWERNPAINQVSIRVAKLALTVVIVAHLVAVSWHLLWILEGQPADGWGAAATLTDATPAESYIYSLYWSVTVLTTVGFGDITPTRPVEMAFTVFVMFVGVTLYAYVIGSIAALIPRPQDDRMEHQEELDALRRFMRRRGFPTDLQSRIINFSDFAWTQTQGDYQRQLLNELPASLRRESAAHLAEHILGLKGIFPDADADTLTHLVMAVRAEIHPPGSAIAAAGQPIEEIYFISEGAARVVSTDGTTLATLEPGDHFGSIADTVQAVRDASVIADGYCSVLRLDRAGINSAGGGDSRAETTIRQVTRRSQRAGSTWRA